jgi:hypothetical protein
MAKVQKPDVSESQTIVTVLRSSILRRSHGVSILTSLPKTALKFKTTKTILLVVAATFNTNGT